MQAIFAKIVAFFMSILAFFGLVKPNDGPKEMKDEIFAKVTEQTIEFQLKANATTGYKWAYNIDGDAVQLKEEHYEEYEHAAGMVGVGGIQYFAFAAVKPGTAKITFIYARNWEEGTPEKIFVYEITVAEDMTVTYKAVE